MKKLMLLGLITIICRLNLCAKSNEVIKINNSSRQVVADKIEDNLKNVLNFNQANIISTEALKKMNSSTYKIIYRKEKSGEYKYTLEKLSNFNNDKNLKVFVNGIEDNLDSAVKKRLTPLLNYQTILFFKKS
jgi:hypothetical protein